jgi:23S rRNA (adenine2503-C2)-methyltransferase
MAVHLLGLTSEELERLAVSLGERSFRGRQLARWLYKRNAKTIQEMTDLPASFRATLAREAVLYRSRILAEEKSEDETAKYLLQVEDGSTVEAVLLPYEDRVSLCVSSQIGCAAGCIFCASALSGFRRNLLAGEIVDEVLTLQTQIPRRISHVVYMGMGEPLLNYDNVLKSIRILNDEVGIAMRHITVSTIGITPRIKRLAKEKLQLTLAVSLHAPNDELRNTLMPLTARYPLQELISACKEYIDLTHRRMTFEYLLIRGFNDSTSLAHQLAQLLKGMLCNVNLIPYNTVEELKFKRPLQSQVKVFRSILEEAGITVTQRMERGHSISAACGQLRRREERNMANLC